MKIDLRLSYKRCLSRPKIADINKIKLWRKLFSLKFLSEINPKSLIANWDECSINRNTKLNYSWSVIGMNKEIKNASLTGSISIIMSIFSNGCWFAMLWNTNTNSQVFLHYISKINEWLNCNKLFGYDNIYMILDNCSYHKSSETIKQLWNSEMKIVFLPPYSPSLAPIELIFGWIKRKLCKNLIGTKLSLDSKEASNAIFNVIKEIDKRLVINIFGRFYRELKINLNFVE